MAAVVPPTPRLTTASMPYEHATASRPPRALHWLPGSGGGITNFTDAQVRDRPSSSAALGTPVSSSARARWSRSRSRLQRSVQQHHTPSAYQAHQTARATAFKAWRAITSRVPRCSHYIVGGAGWKHYALAGDKFNVSVSATTTTSPKSRWVACRLSQERPHDGRARHYAYALNTACLRRQDSLGARANSLQQLGACA